MSNLLRLDDYRKPVLVKSSEVKKVSLDDGYTQIPNELLIAMSQFPFTQQQYSIVLALIIKTLSWKKETDWVSNSQIAELTGIKKIERVSEVKNQLIQMNVLVKSGNKIGVNFVVSEWESKTFPKNGNPPKKLEEKFPKSGNRHSQIMGTTKETITKEKINNPLPPNGESANAEASKSLAENKIQGNNSQPVGKKTKSAPVNYQGVVDLYNRHNEETGGRLPEAMVLNDKRRRAIKRFMSELSRPELACVNAYFQCFFESLSDFYLGKNDRAWVASFDYAIRSDTVTKVREGTL